MEIPRTRAGIPYTLPAKLREMEAINLSDAYSSLKEIHLTLKKKLSISEDIITDLKSELDDYKTRYDALIKYVNTLDVD